MSNILKRVFRRKNTESSGEDEIPVKDETKEDKNLDVTEDRIDLAKDNRKKRVIAITNQKGGVGKSTTAINLSSYLGSMSYKTLIIDLDPQNNSTTGLGIQKDSIEKSVYDLLIDGLGAEKVILKTDFENLYLIPSSIELAGAEVELVSAMRREFRLSQTLKNVKDEFDFIIIDCPPALGLLTINALTSSEEILIPIQCEYYALEGLGQLMNTIRLVQDNLNGDLVISGVLMTMYDSRTKLSDQVVEEVKAYFPDKVYQTIIPRNVRLSEAPSHGLPILKYDSSCPGAKAYKKLTEEVIGNG